MTCIVTGRDHALCMLSSTRHMLNQEACISASVHGIRLHLLLTVQVCLMALYSSPVESGVWQFGPVPDRNAARQMGRQLHADRYITKGTRQQTWKHGACREHYMDQPLNKSVAQYMLHRQP